MWSARGHQSTDLTSILSKFSFFPGKILLLQNFGSVSWCIGKYLDRIRFQNPDQISSIRHKNIFFFQIMFKIFVHQILIMKKRFVFFTLSQIRIQFFICIRALFSSRFRSGSGCSCGIDPDPVNLNPDPELCLLE